MRLQHQHQLQAITKRRAAMLQALARLEARWALPVETGRPAAVQQQQHHVPGAQPTHKQHQQVGHVLQLDCSYSCNACSALALSDLVLQS